MAPTSTALRIDDAETHDYEHAPIPKAARFAFARAHIEVASQAEPRKQSAEKATLDLTQEIATAAALYSSQRLYFERAPVQGRTAPAEVNRKVWRLRMIASWAFALSSFILVNAVFLAGYNFHQQDAYGLLRWVLLGFAASFALTGAFSVLQRLRVVRGETRSATSVVYPARGPSPTPG